ncbi:Clavaminate synthase-like protein [Hypoxylon fragiforme]|uniref:Clavaminate synthase-like protein n=1 Tax=Hypoxylon fragiforme TaxID=63214 RepID=UPI0020C616A1|nr:Clavaminate synthase-like protein [Hypoxylon fragiforme]KAI2611221.1 Clavaminate synthase-like protein [Hypoxylon fragiforme]
MAPAIDTESPVDIIQGLKAQAKKADRSIFPDGLKTTGQHPPLYDQLYPYSAFPKHIEGPTVWKAEDYANNPERWVHPFSESELEEISQTADTFIASGLPLTGISKDNFRLPGLEPSLITMRRELLNGKGFLLYKGFPVDEWGTHKSAVAYMGLGAYLGYPVSQNGRGHILGHVQDLGEDSTQIDKVRIYRTNARQFFHADDCDIVGLLCIAKAEFGGESDVSSIHHVWNILQAERPDVAELLTQPVWYFDRKGEVSQGEEPYIRTAVFYLETPDPAGEAAPQRVYCKWDPYYVRSLKRFSDAGLIPPLSPAQEEATAVLEATCERVKLHMVLAVGDIQFVSNSHTLHARTAYRDFGPDSGKPRRHLMRLWLSVPEDEGGWRLPFWDSGEKKRGGIQVDDTPPVARLDAD